MPTPTIPAGNLFMNATLYTGNGSTQTITNGAAGQAFQPDLVWIKVRSTGYSHRLVDSVRGATKLLYSDLPNAESTDAASLTSFNSNGFSLGNAAGTNDTSQTFVGWQWKAGGTAVTNTSGTISSQVSANTTSGFSVVTYTGTGANATVGHGLSSAPKFVIIKNRVGVYNWRVWHSALSGTEFLYLNATDSTVTNAAMWNSTIPTSTVFSLGTNAGVNNSGDTFIAYCWSEIAGFSQFGSYTGNGSADGPFVYLGFRPKFVMIKQSNAVEYWYMWDSTRNTYNVLGNDLIANLSNAEGTNTIMDFTSNGFKIRTSAGAVNTSGGTYIYMAFAENPFKYSNAR
jgi:hypothetical protein